MKIYIGIMIISAAILGCGGGGDSELDADRGEFLDGTIVLERVGSAGDARLTVEVDSGYPGEIFLAGGVTLEVEEIGRVFFNVAWIGEGPHVLFYEGSNPLISGIARVEVEVQGGPKIDLESMLR